MSSSAEDYGEWWKIEPPDHELEPPENNWLPDEDDLNAADLGIPVPVDRREYRDARQPIPLFEDILIIEDTHGIRFETPTRFLTTPHDGMWAVEVSGRLRRFKERDDYGEIRFVQNGDALWIPHLFPFEETDEKGLPVIRDRERCEMEVSLQHVSKTGNTRALNVAIQTQYGNLTATESADSYNPEFRSIFNDFTFEGRPLVSDLVTYPQRRWSTLEEYLRECSPQTTTAEYIAMMQGQIPRPPEYVNQRTPNDWSERTPSGYGGTAFGAVWVPIDQLRQGIDASLSFPCFQD